jgi:hypothetical protein
MIKTSDILRLPYTPDLTEGGIAFACRSLATSSNLKRSFSEERLRHLVAGMAVELAFRRSLNEQDIPFHVLGSTPFTHPTHYDVSLGGHRCELNCHLITRRQQITRLRKDPALALQAPALLPIEQFSAEEYKPQDVHIFAFLLGLVAVSGEEMDKALAAGQPACLIHPLPGGWNCPADWHPLENLALKSECEQPITIEIGGLNSEREFTTTRLELSPKKRAVVEQCYHSLAYLCASRIPECRIGLHSPIQGEAYVISPREWINIWVYGMDIVMMGWLSHEEFRRKAKVLNAGMRTFQVERTREKNLFVPMEELNPLTPLYKRVQSWSTNSQQLQNNP